MNLWLPVLCVFLVTPFSETCQLLPTPLKMAAFNIKTFGVTKMGKSFLAGIISDRMRVVYILSRTLTFLKKAVKIVKRYDVILIQEIRDASGEALQDLHDLVNSTEYNLTYSERHGRTSYKEQYAYFTRLATVEVLDTFQYDDGPEDPVNHTDAFEREPFAIKVRSVGGSLILAIIGIHTKPKEAVKEIGLLHNVTYNVTAHWTDVQDVIIMGDLNADCSYAKESKLLDAEAEVLINPNYFWPIDFTADTTTSTTDCAYDRFILLGLDVRTSFVPCSAGIFDYGAEYNLTYEQTKDVSDHYPVELELR